MKKVTWGEKKYYSDLTENSFMHTRIGKEKKIPNDYKYVPKSKLVKCLRFLFYYIVAVPVCWIYAKLTCSVKVKGKKNIKKLKGGAVLIGNHSHPLDCMFASVFVAAPKRNYIIANKEAVEVVGGRYFTKALGALPLPDNMKGLANLSDAVTTLLKQGNNVTIFPEAAIWPYSTFLRPFPSANFHYAAVANVPIVPFAVTYRYAKHRPLRKKPKVNVTISEPIYADKTLALPAQKKDLATRTFNAVNQIVSRDNVSFVEYVKKD